MSTMPIYVISNGGLFREAFNAIVTLLGTSSFSTAMRLSMLLAAYGVVFQYIKSRDVMTMLKWFGMYFAITSVLLIPKVDVEIIDSTDSGAVYNVENVPYGLAYPASVITSMAHAFETAVETAFHMPDDASYSKTGLLFGSQLFSLSTGFHFIDPNVTTLFNQYVKNCVAGDILINHKYTLHDVMTSADLWQTISQNPSPVRGLYVNGLFTTCRDATPLLKKAIDNEVNNNVIPYYGKYFFSGNKTKDPSELLKQYLPSAYRYYANLSKSASQIVSQNVMMNGLKQGVLQYASEAGATASLLNLSASQSFERMRMAWATSRMLATYTLPLMQTVMLLLMLCLFPVVILLAVQPGFGLKMLKNYIYSLIWVETWPILFSFLNLAVTFYLRRKTSGWAVEGFTLSNSNRLALMHSDIAGIAGYLMSCIPFIAIGIVRGMAFAFNNAANYIGGMMHSVASSSASEAVSGNISVGNTNVDNVNANKHNTNFTDLHGMHTEQMRNGALVTQTADGHQVIDTHPAMSQLPISVSASAMTSSHFSHAADTSKQAANQWGESFSHSVSSASNQLASFGKSSAFHQSEGSSDSVTHTTTADQAASHLYSVTKDVADRNHVSFHEAFQGLTQFSQGGDIHGSVGAGFARFGGNIGAKASIGAQHTRSNTASTSHDQGTSFNVSNSEAQQFRDNWSVIKNYSENDSASQSHSQNASLLHQLSSDFRQADSASKNYSTSMSESVRDTDIASFAKNHSAGINANFAQNFADYVRHVEPERATTLLENTNSLRVGIERQALAERFVKTELANQIEKGYDATHSDQGAHALYQSGLNQVHERSNHLEKGFTTQSQHIRHQGDSQGATFTSSSQTKQAVHTGEEQGNNVVHASQQRQEAGHEKATTSEQERMKQGAEKADTTAFKFWGSVEPDYLKHDDKKGK